MVAFLLGSLYMCLLYGLYVPNWKYEVPSPNSSSSTSRYGFDSQIGHRQRVFWWSISSFPLLISGYVIKVLGIPFSKPLYTLSYMCITAGASGFLLTIIFYIVDVNQVKKPTMVLQWMGMNALIIYALGACDLFPAALQGF